MNRILLAALLGGMLYITSCKDDPPADPEATLELKVEYIVGDQALETDSIRYMNQAGNPFSVSRLEFFLSGVELFREGAWESLGQYAYFNPKGNSDVLKVSARPIRYDSIRFYMGLGPEWNLSNALPSKLKYVNMAWPDVMGGGYHFIKLEGHFPDTAGVPRGYALHVGKHEALRRISLALPSGLQEGTNKLTLSMDVKAWMGAEHLFDFQKGETYTMGIDSLMYLLADNGARSMSVLKLE